MDLVKNREAFYDALWSGQDGNWSHWSDTSRKQDPVVARPTILATTSFARSKVHDVLWTDFHFCSDMGETNRQIHRAILCNDEDKGFVVVSNYVMLSTRNAGPTNGVTSLVKKIMKDVTWDVRILDEAHCAPAHTHRAFLDKNRDGVASKYIRTICLTGTLVRDESLKERMSSYETERVELQQGPLPLSSPTPNRRTTTKILIHCMLEGRTKKGIDQQNTDALRMHFAR